MPIFDKFSKFLFFNKKILTIFLVIQNFLFNHTFLIFQLLLLTPTIISPTQAEDPTTTMKPKIVKRQLHPWQQLSALNNIQRQLQHLNDHIEDSYTTLDSLESFSRNKDRLTQQLRTIREDLILLKRSLTWLARFTNLARALLPNPYMKPDDFSYPPLYFPDLYLDVNEPHSELSREKPDITLREDFQPPETREEYPPFSRERFQERMLQAGSNSLPKLEENRTLFEKDVEEEKQIVDEEIALTLPSNIAANFKDSSSEPEAKASESFQMSSFLLPPFRSKYLTSRLPDDFESEREFSFLPSFESHRKFRNLGEVPLDKHSFFDMPRSFRRSLTSFEAPIR